MMIVMIGREHLRGMWRCKTLAVVGLEVLRLAVVDEVVRCGWREKKKKKKIEKGKILTVSFGWWLIISVIMHGY